MHEVGRWRGRDYLVTEYVEGVTLRTRMRNEKREPRMVFLKSEPKWNSLRGDPRFRDLLQRLGFIG